MDIQVYRALCAMVGENHVLCREPMNRHTTFRTGGEAEYLVAPSADALPKVVAYCREADIPWIVIGNGSNLLVGDGGVDGLVIELGRQMAQIAVDGDRITAGAGALLSAIAAKAAEAELSGFEFAFGIPGSIGGAVVMNAGAYGGEMKDVLRAVTVLTRDGEIKRLEAKELELSYRHSVIPERGYIVLEAELALRPAPRAKIDACMEELKRKRAEKQPLEYPSAGSTFKRPQGYFAAKLIDDAGLRGYRIGDAQVSEKHCGFVVNLGKATSGEIRSLMEHVQREVRDRFGVELEPEVKLIGKF